MNRPASPNTVLEDAKEGGDAIKKDWEVTKLKKRVDANEEGIERLNNLLDSLAKQIKNLENKQNDMANRVGKTITDSLGPGRFQSFRSEYARLNILFPRMIILSWLSKGISMSFISRF